MFRDRKTSNGPHLDYLERISPCNLKSAESIKEVLQLGQRLWEGDWSATARLADMHMRVCAFLAKYVAFRYHQDIDDMVGWSYFGIIDACAKVAAHEVALDNLSGYIIARSKSMCINHCEDQATGLSRDDVRQMTKEGRRLPQRESLDFLKNTLEEPSVSDPLVQAEFLDSFMPDLTEREFDLFCLYLQSYTDDEAMEELAIHQSRLYVLRNQIEHKFNMWMSEWYKFKKLS